jgi:hypothetical protein
VDNQAIVIPEAVDAISALTGIVKEGCESVRITDEALGIGRDYLASGGNKGAKSHA